MPLRRARLRINRPNVAIQIIEVPRNTNEHVVADDEHRTAARDPFHAVDAQAPAENHPGQQAHPHTENGVDHPCDGTTDAVRWVEPGELSDLPLAHYVQTVVEKYL